MAAHVKNCYMQAALSEVDFFLISVDSVTCVQFFQDEGCKMVEMSCEQHDSLAAETQFTTHFVGRTLGHMGLKETPIDTTGYQALLKLIQNTNNDSRTQTQSHHERREHRSHSSLPTR